MDAPAAPDAAQITAARDAAMRLLQARGELRDLPEGRRIVVEAGALRLVLRCPIHETPPAHESLLRPTSPAARPWALCIHHGGALAAVLAWAEGAPPVASCWAEGPWLGALAEPPVKPGQAKAARRRGG